MKQHFLGWFCRWLNARGILTHPQSLKRDPCRTVTEYVDAWRITPRRLVIWRVRRTLSIVYSRAWFERMMLVKVQSYDQTMPKRGVRWHVTFTAGCGVPE